jgi:hypothetical protein
MQKHVCVLTTSAFVIAFSAIAASAQQGPGGAMMQQPTQRQTEQQSSEEDGASTMRDIMGRRMWQRGMIGPGMMRQGGAMAAPFMMRMMFALMDADGDGTISLQEFQAAHERIFKAMDANKDGRLSFEEIEAFIHGRRPAPQQ